MSPTPGTRLGFYEILSAVGAGGVGEVYRAHDHRLNRDVAVKVLPEGFASDPDRLARFEREAQAVAALSHPNILAIHEFGSAGPRGYAVMELLQGETLRERLAGGPLGVRKALDYASQMARGLAAAHDKGIVHRDLKPENAAVHQHKRAERRGEDGRRLLFTSGHSGLRLLDSLTGTTHDLMSAARGLTEFPSVAKARKHALIAFVEKGASRGICGSCSGDALLERHHST